MRYAYIATDPKTNECFAIHSACPEHMDGFEKELRSWRKRDAKIEIMPRKLALEKFAGDKK